jgi:N-acetylmuramoyl-L-alanine amidase
MSYPIKQEIIPGLPRKAYRKGVSAYEGVVDHSTATLEATDERESIYFHREWKNRQAFPHFCVDWDSITQLADINYLAWAAGNGNPRYVHIELCETKDPAKFLESYKRYVWLTAKILKDKNLGVTDGGTLVSHAWVSKHLGGTDHVDPIGYLKSHDVSWAQHIINVKTEYDSYFKKPAVKVSQSNAAFWDGMELKKGQKGRITILKPINLYKRVGDKLEMVRILQPDEVYRVYGYDNEHGGQYNVGGLYVTKMDGYIKFETPSKAMQERVK